MKLISLKFFLILVLLVAMIGLILTKNTSKTEGQLQVTQTSLKDVEIIAQNLNIPWEVVFLPDREILVTQRPGTLLLVKNKQQIPIAGVEHIYPTLQLFDLSEPPACPLQVES